jgi:hypothetical protein
MKTEENHESVKFAGIRVETLTRDLGIRSRRQRLHKDITTILLQRLQHATGLCDTETSVTAVDNSAEGLACSAQSPQTHLTRQRRDQNKF